MDSKGTRNTDAPWVRWLVGWPGLALALVWGLAEGTVFFVVPDVAISLVAILRPRPAWRHVVAATLGALVAGALMFNWAILDPAGARAEVGRVPFVRAEMVTTADASYAKHGVGAIFLGPLGGIPYKIYAVEGPKFLSYGEFLAATVPARCYRFVVVWIAFGITGHLVRRYLRRTDLRMLIWHGAFWVILYVVYWGRILMQ